MNIVFVVARNASGKGGMETVLTGILKNWRYPSDNINLIVPRLNGTGYWLKDLPYRKLWFKAKWLEYPLLILNLFYFLRKIQPEIIIAADSKAVQYCCWYRNILSAKTRVACWIHSSLNVKKKKRVLDADIYLSISAGMRTELTGFGVDKDKIKVVYNPVDQQALISRSAQPVFIYMGRLVADSEKCVGDFLSALAKLNGVWQAVIIGNGPDTNKLKKLSVSLNIADKIIWYDWLEEPWSVVKEASCLVLTSEAEGFGMVLVEAMQRGIPCISADCPSGPGEIIIDGHNGWLYRPRDVDDLAGLLQNVLNTPDILPPAEKVQKSVEKFKTETVVENIRNAFL